MTDMTDASSDDDVLLCAEGIYVFAREFSACEIIGCDVGASARIGDTIEDDERYLRLQQHIDTLARTRKRGEQHAVRTFADERAYLRALFFGDPL